MITLAEITDEIAAASRASSVCPACGGVKIFGCGCCAACWGALVDGQRIFLIDQKVRVGQTRALFELLAHLDAEVIHLPALEQLAEVRSTAGSDSPPIVVST